MAGAMSTRPDDAVSPIFVGGLMRSGTTLLRAMLAQHSNIAGGLETHWCDIDWQHRTGRRGEMLDAWLERMFAFFDFDPQRGAEIVARSRDVRAFMDQFMGDVAAREGKRRWVEKTTDNILHVERIFDLWPAARMLHVVRDPRDCFLSFHGTPKQMSPQAFASLWSRYVGGGCRIDSLARSRGWAVHRLRYEALAMRPEPVMREVIAFVGEPWEEQVAFFSGKDDEYAKVLALTGHESSTLRRLQDPLTTERVALWRKRMPADLRAEVEAALLAQPDGDLAEAIMSEDFSDGG